MNLLYELKWGQIPDHLATSQWFCSDKTAFDEAGAGANEIFGRPLASTRRDLGRLSRRPRVKIEYLVRIYLQLARGVLQSRRERDQMGFVQQTHSATTATSQLAIGLAVASCRLCLEQQCPSNSRQWNTLSAPSVSQPPTL